MGSTLIDLHDYIVHVDIEGGVLHTCLNVFVVYLHLVNSTVSFL